MLKRNLKLRLEFYKSTLIINLIISVVFGLLTKSVNAFGFSFTLIGFSAALFYKEIYRKHEYYLYYNAGISRQQLVIFCFLLNCLFSILVKICML
ncbi:hypothetical protein SAMN05421741_13527 [Paenimyroides ummariense]|uniref:Uncharacterized protein n=1 Tax=Paenimyroides ummariense TaxID=913024 RepID=A0A1I5G4Y1_9FLAO|nr:hypothetical protein SAMN05421741_13527 [Paenimyroides ummariense]